MSKKVNDLVEKYRAELPPAFLAEFELTGNVLSADIAGLIKGDVVKIIASEYSGRTGTFVEHNDKFGQPFVSQFSMRDSR